MSPPQARKAPRLSRAESMACRPTRLPVVCREEGPDREIRLTAQYSRPRWQQRLGADAVGRRTYVLDTLGREVYESCDGLQSVCDIVAAFARNHAVSIAEAEYAVTTYLNTLIRKGLLAMVVVGEKP